MSDSDSHDSDAGVRFKTDSVRGKEERIIGPALPPHLVTTPKVKEDVPLGPKLPPHLIQNEVEEEEDGTYGPLPAGQSNKSKAHVALEERALQLKMEQLEPAKDKVQMREEWMLELPEVNAARFGLGPRQFRSKAGPDLANRSSWTDTPNSKKNQEEEKEDEVDLAKITQDKEIKRRDEEQEKMLRQHKKKRKESLLQLHQNKMKKMKKEEQGSSERRPFSRDIDLQVNRFDEAQKKAVLKKAQLLDDRFSRGKSKYL